MPHVRISDMHEMHGGWTVSAVLRAHIVLHADVDSMDMNQIKSLKLTQGILMDSMPGNTYDGDVFPPGTPSDIVRKMKHIPEEFFSSTGIPVVRPDNVRQFLKTHQAWEQAHGKKIVWHVMELFGCTGRFSLTCHQQGLHLGPVIDFRHGWDFRLQHHRTLVTALLEHFQVRIGLRS